MRVILISVLTFILLSSFASASFSISGLQDVYTISPCSNYTINFSLDVYATNETNYIKLYFVSPIDASIYPSYVISTNETASYPIKINISLPCDYNSGSYESKVYAVDTSNNLVSEKVFNVSILPIALVEFSPAFINLTSNNSTGCFYFVVTNKGNSRIEFNLTNQKLLSFKPQKVVLYRGESERVRACWNVTSNFTSNITYSLSISNYTYNISISLIDKRPPEISEIFLEPNVTKVNQTVKVLAIVRDNSAVKNVYVKINNKTYDMSALYDDTYFYELTYDTIGSKNITIKAIDIYDNLAERNYTIEYSYKEDNFSTEINIGKIKKDMSMTYKILEFDELTKIKIFNVTIPDNITLEFYNEKNEKIELIRDASVELKTLLVLVKGYTNKKFDIYFDVLLPEYYKNPLKHFKLSGEISDYTVTPDFTIDIYGTEISCKSNDKGVYEDSFKLCSVKLPIDTKKEDIIIWGNIKTFDEMESSYKAKEQEYLNKINFQNFIILILIIIIIVILVVIYYFTRIKPFLLGV